MVNKINLLRKPLLRYQYFNNGIKSKKMAFFDFGVTTCKTTKKWQKEGRFTTPVPVDPELVKRASAVFVESELSERIDRILEEKISPERLMSLF